MIKKHQFSAPGSIMLMGEHAVLRNKLALVGAVDKRITVTLTPYENNQIDIYSALTEYHAILDALDDHPKLRFVIAAIKFCQKKLTHGFRLDISSEFSSKVGLGSSAAVVVATLACLQQYQQFSTLLKKGAGEHRAAGDFMHQLFLDARTIIQQVQGRGSGADVAASVFGGIVAYRMEPFFIEKAENLFDIALLYTGYKTPTPEVIKIVDAHIQSDHEKYNTLFDQMNFYSENAWQAIQNENWDLLGKIMNQHQQAQNQLGVCDEKSAELMALLHQDSTVLGCKISGSGLGDCVVALVAQKFQWKNEEFEKINAKLSVTGVRCES